MQTTIHNPVEVLCVSRDTDTAARIRRGFDREPYPFDVTTAASADEGLSLLAEADIDCVVSEFDLPGVDGLTFLEEVREDRPDVPFVLLTDEYAESVARAAVSAGVTDYRTKRPDSDQYQLLATRIADAVDRQRTGLDYREVFEKIPDGMTLHDSDGAILDVNQQFAEMLGYSREELLEMDFDALHVDEPPYTSDRATELVGKAAAEGPQTFEWVDETKDGERLPVEVSLRQTRIGGKERILAVVRDITERKQRERQLQQRSTAMERSTDGIAIVDADGDYAYVNQAHAEVYGYDDADAFIGESWEMCYTDAELETIENEVFPELEAESHWRGELTGLRRDGDTFPQELSLTMMDDGGIVCVVRDVTEQKEYEDRLRTLHDATREMMQETDRERICQTAVDTAQNALDLPISTIWLRSDDPPRLEPVAWSDQAEALFDEMPVFEPGNSISWQVFEEGDIRVFDDVRREDNRYNSETDIRGELMVSIGEYGVLNSGSTDPGEFGETDVALARLLAANTRAALERADREATLQRQTDQMEFFNSILRHDVLNGMTVIQGRTELLAEDLEGAQLRDAETILKWCDDIVEIVQRVRTTIDTLTGESDVQLESVELTGTIRAELDRVRKTHPDVTFETSLPDSVTVRATELLGEVLGNVLTNAVHHNDTDGLRVSITASREPERNTATVRVADNGSGVPDEAKEAIFRRDETGHAKSSGSGFGLFFVDSMVDEYGGDVRVEDNEMGGATFVVELPLAEAATPA